MNIISQWQNLFLFFLYIAFRKLCQTFWLVLLDHYNSVLCFDWLLDHYNSVHSSDWLLDRYNSIHSSDWLLDHYNSIHSDSESYSIQNCFKFFLLCFSSARLHSPTNDTFPEILDCTQNCIPFSTAVTSASLNVSTVNRATQYTFF